MKNLENYGVLEMNSQEIKETDGGGFWAAIAVGAIGSFLYEVVNDWDANVAAFNQGNS